MTGTIEAAVIAAEKRRCDAMLANDAATLDAVLDQRLQFSHATGAVDDKPAYLAKMAAGRIEYLSIEWSDESVIKLAETAALLTGRMRNRVLVDGTEKLLDNRVLSAWSLDGSEWRAVAFQSTPLKV